MDGEEDIIGLDWDNTLGVFIFVLLLNTVNPEECDVVAAIESEANNVQREEIKVETNYAENKRGGKSRASHVCVAFVPFSPVVVPDLRIE